MSRSLNFADDWAMVTNPRLCKAASFETPVPRERFVLAGPLSYSLLAVFFVLPGFSDKKALPINRIFVKAGASFGLGLLTGLFVAGTTWVAMAVYRRSGLFEDYTRMNFSIPPSLTT